MSSQAVNKSELKAALEELMRERNPEFIGFLDEILRKHLASVADGNTPLSMDKIRKHYALHRDSFAPLHQLFQEAPPASELVKKLHK